VESQEITNIIIPGYQEEEIREVTMAELNQLHNMQVFQLVKKSTLRKQELLGVLNTITFFKQKRKAQTCADGRPQRKLYDKGKASSPTVRTESVLITSVVDAYEEQSVGVFDIPGAFLHSEQTDVVYVKMCGDIATFLVEVSPETYSAYTIIENGKETLYLMLRWALYGCIKSALLFWQDLPGKLKKRGCVLNPYDLCKTIHASQLAIVRHIDDLKISLRSEQVLDEEIKWLESIYGPLVGVKGTNHTYLGMNLAFQERKLCVSMKKYLREIIE
jgi:hypothetical protein